MATASERVPLLGQAPECRGAASRGAVQSPEPVARYREGGGPRPDPTGQMRSGWREAPKTGRGAERQTDRAVENLLRHKTHTFHLSPPRLMIPRGPISKAVYHWPLFFFLSFFWRSVVVPGEERTETEAGQWVRPFPETAG